MWKLIASLTVAAGMALAASSDFALGGDKVPKKTGNARCVQLSNGESMCLTCQDGPCDIKSGLANPVTTSAGSGIVRHSSANSPKPKVSANHALNDETKRSSRIVPSATTAQVAWQSSPPCANARSDNVRSACGASGPDETPEASGQPLFPHAVS